MLKKAMQEIIDSQNEQINSFETRHRVDQELIKSAADKERKHTKLKVHVNDALSSINGIMAVNCSDIQEWHKHGNAALRYASDLGEDAPVCPQITELYSSLSHIEGILCRPVEREENIHSI